MRRPARGRGIDKGYVILFHVDAGPLPLPVSQLQGGVVPARVAQCVSWKPSARRLGCVGPKVNQHRIFMGCFYCWKGPVPDATSREQIVEPPQASTYRLGESRSTYPRSSDIESRPWEVFSPNCFHWCLRGESAYPRCCRNSVLLDSLAFFSIARSRTNHWIYHDEGSAGIVDTQKSWKGLAIRAVGYVRRLKEIIRRKIVSSMTISLPQDLIGVGTYAEGALHLPFPHCTSFIPQQLRPAKDTS